MSLLKIPFIIASAFGIRWSLAISKPPSSEVRVSTASESCLSWALDLHMLGILEIITWAVSFAEVASILVTRLGVGPSQVAPEKAIVVQLLSTLHPTPITTAFLAGSLAVTIGGVVRLYCALTLGKHWNSLLSVRKGHRLVTTGPYSVVRHPSYTAYLLQYVGLTVMHGSQGSWMRESGILQIPFVKVLAAVCFSFLTVFSVLPIRRPPMEDKMLHEALGEEWENWAKKVKYRLLPGVY